jgi:hypothetical protein
VTFFKIHLIQLHELLVADPEAEVLALVRQEEDVRDEVERLGARRNWGGQCCNFENIFGGGKE